MADDASPLASFSLTHIRYDPSDPVSHVCAWLALLPQALCVVYVTLVLTTREAEVALMFAGQMACEAVNFALKRIFKEQRPPRFHGRGYGMPSSHAQFLAFWAVAISLFLLLRHRPSYAGPGRTTPATTQKLGPALAAASAASAPHDPSSPSREHYSLVQRLAVSGAALGLAGLVGWSRIYLRYHTERQVLVGVCAGVSCAVVWFAAVAAIRRSGMLDGVLRHPLARYFRFRDLLVEEDMCQAGWEKWEEKRMAREKKKA